MIQEEREERHKYKGVVKTVISTQSEDPMMAALKCVEGNTYMYYIHVHILECISYNILIKLLYNLILCNRFNYCLIIIGFKKIWQYIFITIVFKSVVYLQLQ